jgi:transposase
MIISGDDPVSKGPQRFEVFTGAGKRRDWSDAEKAWTARPGIRAGGDRA